MKTNLNSVVLLITVLFNVNACQEKKQERSSNTGSRIQGLDIYIQVEQESTVDYNRKEWMPEWADFDRDGMNTRHEILASQSLIPAEIVEKKGKVYVSKGSWICPYTGKKHSNPKDLDIDHLIPLKEAHVSGGWKWSTEQRIQFANGVTDSLELLVTQKRANQDKSDQDPAEWMPPLKGVHCNYLQAWTLVKAKAGLTMDNAEFERVSEGLNECHRLGKSPYKIKRAA